MANLVHGVTKENFSSLAATFAELNGGVLFGVCVKEWLCDREIMPATISQWGAWRAYRKSRKLPTGFMDQRAREGKSFTVPAEWPHLFDSDATVLEDHENGEMFRQNYRPENPIMADAAARQATVASLKSRFPSEAKRQKTPQDHLNPEAARAKEMVDALLYSHDVGLSSSKRRPTGERAA